MENIRTTKVAIRPPQPPGPLKWVRDNLFNNWYNTLLTVVLVPTVLFVLVQSILWVFTKADWRPIIENPMLFAVGQYPRDQLWRVAIGLSGIMFLMGASWGKWGGLLRTISLSFAIVFAFLALLPVQLETLDTDLRIYLGSTVLLIFIGAWLGRLKAVKKAYILIGWAIMPIISIIFLIGFEGVEKIPEVSTTFWGGLLVTFLLSAGGILASFPIGLALALGRRSSLPVVKGFSIAFIETVRGVPLVTILFMFSIILVLLLPADSSLDRLFRAWMAVTFFSAAYTAENIRGGLQAVPIGQIEAAKAVGMNAFQTMLFIVMPQALRAVLPTIVGQFISLFKDTTLVVIVGINDLLGIGRSVINMEPAFLQLDLEVYMFIAAVYWVFSYFMSRASARLETTMGTRTTL